jgi:hypothetical protein
MPRVTGVAVKVVAGCAKCMYPRNWERGGRCVFDRVLVGCDDMITYHVC